MRVGTRLLLAAASFVACLIAATPALAKDDLADLLRQLRHEKDPALQRELVRRLGSSRAPRAAGSLAELVREDRDATIRAEAARALGRIRTDNALDLLLDLADRGGVHTVRKEVALALLRREGGRQRATELLTDKRVDPAGRAMFLHVLGASPDLEAAATLETYARGPDPHLRCEALRALAEHKHGRDMLPDVLVRVLTDHQDTETVLCGLDLARSIADADFEPVARLLGTFLEPEVQRAVQYAQKRLDYAKALARFRKAQEDGYGTRVPPREPPPRPRYDIVYVCDTTGSVVGHLPRIADKIHDEILLLNRLGSDVRVGIVAYRDTTRRRGMWATHVLPLSYDVQRAVTFLRAQRTGGADSQGATILGGLTQALDRMSWRWNARRQTTLVADSKAGKPRRCLELTRLHWDEDRTGLRVWWVKRTRSVLPKEISQLARLCGGTLEIIE